MFAVLLILVALVCVLWPLLKQGEDSSGASISEQNQNIAHFREQLSDLDAQQKAKLLSMQEHKRLKTELEKKLVEEIEQAEALVAHSNRKTPAFAWLLALLVPILALPLYWKLGAQSELKVQEALFSNTISQKELGSRLEGWVEKSPENDKALFLLGSHYMENGQFDKAENTYRKLFRISNGHPQVAAELAQTLFLRNDNEMTDEVRMLYKRTLRTEAENTTALGLQGIDAFSSGDYKGAISAWKKAIAHEVNPGARHSLNQGINKAQEMLGTDVASNSIKVLIDKVPELSSLPDTARIVVFARPAGTSQPPIVAIPLTVGDLPRELVLDDSSTMMMGGNTLSSYEALDIVGRISLSGDVMKADYQVQVSNVKSSGSESVKLIFTPAG